MSSYRVGSFVLHSKMQDLGAGEIVMIDKGAIRIRFASGERSFAEQQATPYLEVTAEGPLPPTPAARKKAARKTATKRATKSAGNKPSSPPVKAAPEPPEPADDDGDDD